MQKLMKKYYSPISELVLETYKNSPFVCPNQAYNCKFLLHMSLYHYNENPLDMKTLKKNFVISIKYYSESQL